MTFGRLPRRQPLVNRLQAGDDLLLKSSDLVLESLHLPGQLRNSDVDSVDDLRHRVLVHPADFVNELLLYGGRRLTHLEPYGRKFRPHLGPELQKLPGQGIDPPW